MVIDPALMEETPAVTPATTGTRSQRGSMTAAPSDRFLRSEVTVEEKFERMRKEDGFAIGVLNKPSFRKLESSIRSSRLKLTSNAIAFGYQADKPVERPTDAFVRTVDLPETELSDRVEYDMDEQDDFWLEAYNARRRLREGDAISREIFEITLTKIEKEWAALEKRIPKPEKKRLDEHTSEDAKCSICDDGECENTNAIVFCDGCNLAVHQECYGVPYIPEGQWLCRKCFASPIDPVTCLFCPAKGGAFKQTSDLHWAHLLCTNWIPEVAVGNPVFMEPIEGVNNIPSSRWKLTCYICKLKVGACIQCSHKACYASFHVTCARRAKLFLQHNPQNPLGLGKTFCDKHLPDWYRAEVDVEAGLQAAQQFFHQGEERSALAGLTSRGGGKFTISLKRTKQAAVIPAIVFNEILQYMQKFRIRNKADYIAEMCKYWSLKRRARRGASLLKRLQLQMDDHAAAKLDEEDKQNKLGMADRLLQELGQYFKPMLDDVAEREALKREMGEMRDQLVEMIYLPLQPILHGALEALEEADTQSTLVKTAPLVEERIPFALTWPKLCRKVDEAHYLSVAMFETDLNAVLSSLLDAFPTATREYKTCLKLRERSSAVLAEARQRERALQIHPESMMATVFEDEFAPRGLTVLEERPWNWANREASPLSEVEDDFVDQLQKGYTEEEYEQRKMARETAEALVQEEEPETAEAPAPPRTLSLPKLPKFFWPGGKEPVQSPVKAPVKKRVGTPTGHAHARLKTLGGVASPRPASAPSVSHRGRPSEQQQDPASAGHPLTKPLSPRTARPPTAGSGDTPLSRPLTGSRACPPCKAKKTRCDGHHWECIKNPTSPLYDPDWERTLTLSPMPAFASAFKNRQGKVLGTAASRSAPGTPSGEPAGRVQKRGGGVGASKVPDPKIAEAVADAMTALEAKRKLAVVKDATAASSSTATVTRALVHGTGEDLDDSPRANRSARRKHVGMATQEPLVSAQKRKAGALVEAVGSTEDAEAQAAFAVPDTPTRASKRARRVDTT